MLTKTTAALTIAAGLALMNASAPSASAQVPLVGSGTNLPIPSPNTGEPNYQFHALFNVLHPISFQGTWIAPALSPWIGTFSARGPVPSAANTGVTEYNFSGLTAGFLPSGTFFRFGDVDFSFEISTLTAIDANGILITDYWLTVPVGVWGSGNGSSGEPILTDMPSWSLVGGQYTIDGSGRSGPNPSVAFALTSNKDIRSITISKSAINHSFALAAPVPAPGSMALLLGTAGLIAARRRR